MSLEIPFSVMRTDPKMRDAFLAELAAANRNRIKAYLGDSRRAMFDVDDAMSVFLVAANRALDIARTEDDGRGKNDPAAWCAWRGMMAVKAAVREARGRYSRHPCIRQRAESRMVYTGSFSQVIDSDENEGASIYYADPNNYADEASANIGCADFLARLRGFDRDLARLLIHGETETLSLTCECTDSEHSYIADLARALKCKESRIFKGLRRLRDAAAKEFAA